MFLPEKHLQLSPTHISNEVDAEIRKRFPIALPPESVGRN